MLSQRSSNGWMEISAFYYSRWPSSAHNGDMWQIVMCIYTKDIWCTYNNYIYRRHCIDWMKFLAKLENALCTFYTDFIFDFPCSCEPTRINKNVTYPPLVHSNAGPAMSVRCFIPHFLSLPSEWRSLSPFRLPCAQKWPSNSNIYISLLTSATNRSRHI